MNRTLKIALFITLFAFLLLPGAAYAKSPAAPPALPLQDQFVFGEQYTLKKGETLSGNLWVFGGNATLEEDTRVTGNITVAGGNVHANGTVDGDVNVTGGQIDLLDKAVVHGNINLVGGSLNRASGAQVDGSVNNNNAPQGPFVYTPQINAPVPGGHVDINPLWNLWTKLATYFLRAFLVTFLAVLAVLFWPKPAQLVSQTVMTQPLISGLMGLLTIAVAPLLLVGLAITIIGLPVAFLGIVLLAAAIIFGWIAIGLEVGVRLGKALKMELTLPLAAGIGTLLVTLVVDGISLVASLVGLDCFGWWAPALVGLIGLGAVILSRFGSRPYPTFVTPPQAYPPANPPANWPSDTVEPPAPVAGVDVYTPPADDTPAI